MKTLNQLVSVTNPKLETTEYQYNMVGKLTKITHPDLSSIEKHYDELGRLIKKIDETSKYEKFYYDANGNIIERVKQNGDQLTYEYTNHNLLWKSISIDGIVQYNYDPAGRRKSMTDNTGTTAYAYNPTNGQLNTITYPDGKSIQYSYDEQRNRNQMTGPFGDNIYYNYDSRNRLNKIGESLSDSDAEYTYYKNNLLYQIKQGNGVVSTYTYDGLKLNTLIHQKSDGTVLNTYNYDYDQNNNIISQTDNEGTYQYTYDELDRIKTSDQFNEVYSYDNRGNRQTLQTDNLNGNNADYTYDKRNQLIKVITDGKTVEYKYNGDGLLYERVENGETTRYYYDGDHIIAEANIVNDIPILKARYIRGKGLVATEDQYFNKAYYLHNGHGDVVELRDKTGNTRLNQYTYDIWGNPLIINEAVYNPFRYTGELWDNTTKTLYLRARWYDPSEGRFLNKDTYEGDIKNPLSLNLYTYVHNNPLIYTDPTGYNPFTYKYGDNSYGFYPDSVLQNAVVAAYGIIPFIGGWAAEIINNINGFETISKNDLYGNVKKKLSLASDSLSQAKRLGDISKLPENLKVIGKSISSKAAIISFAITAIDVAKQFINNKDTVMNNLVYNLVGDLESSSREIVIAKYVYALAKIKDLVDNGDIYVKYDWNGSIEKVAWNPEDIDNIIEDLKVVEAAMK